MTAGGDDDLSALGAIARRELATTVVDGAARAARAGVVNGELPRRARVRPTARAAAGLAFVAAAVACGAAWTGARRSAADLRARELARAPRSVTAPPSSAAASAAAGDPPAPEECVHFAPGSEWSVGAPVVASNGGRVVAFDDGTTLSVREGGEVTVLSLDARGGRVRLTRGSVEASFRHRERTRWVVVAGEAEVEVTGTRFELTWEPSRAELGVVMREGSVALHGCGRAPEVLSAGAAGRFACAPLVRRASLVRRAPKRRPGAVVAGPKAELPTEAPVDAAEESRVGSPPVEAPSARELAGRADRARHARAFTEAEALLLELRRAHPSTSEADRAAFDLGVVRFERGSYEAAIPAFEGYLEVAPDGALAREALGRLLESAERVHDAARARDAAARYLALYPAGPHAARAARIAGPRAPR